MWTMLPNDTKEFFKDFPKLPNPKGHSQASTRKCILAYLWRNGLTMVDIARQRNRTIFLINGVEVGWTKHCYRALSYDAWLYLAQDKIKDRLTNAINSFERFAHCQN